MGPDFGILIGHLGGCLPVGILLLGTCASFEQKLDGVHVFPSGSMVEWLHGANT
uniref:Uncharacterized protein n=1 Tax=Aegilops tauschii TaxID=37682 RepID=M8ARB2_AEGTA